MNAINPSSTSEISPNTDLHVILEALLTYACATSIRQAAREVGMSPSGLQKVFDRATPYRSTQNKLEQWYQRHLLGQHATARDLALRALVGQLPRSRRARAYEQISAILNGDDPCGIE